MKLQPSPFQNSLKILCLKDSNDYGEILEKIPRPAPIDEIKIIDAQKEKQQAKKVAGKAPVSLSRIVWISTCRDCILHFTYLQSCHGLFLNGCTLKQ